MAFSQQTMESVDAVAERASELWQGPKPPVGFDFISLISLILTFLQNNCKPKTENSRQTLIKVTYNKVTANGVAGCVECCMTKDRATKLRKKMAKKKGLATKALQDAHFFNAVVAANAERDPSVEGMTNAFDNDESGDDD